MTSRSSHSAPSAADSTGSFIARARPTRSGRDRPTPSDGAGDWTEPVADGAGTWDRRARSSPARPGCRPAACTSSSASAWITRPATAGSTLITTSWPPVPFENDPPVSACTACTVTSGSSTTDAHDAVDTQTSMRCPPRRSGRRRRPAARSASSGARTGATAADGSSSPRDDRRARGACRRRAQSAQVDAAAAVGQLHLRPACRSSRVSTVPAARSRVAATDGVRRGWRPRRPWRRSAPTPARAATPSTSRRSSQPGVAIRRGCGDAGRSSPEASRAQTATARSQRTSCRSRSGRASRVDLPVDSRRPRAAHLSHSTAHRIGSRRDTTPPPWLPSPASSPSTTSPRC